MKRNFIAVFFFLLFSFSWLIITQIPYASAELSTGNNLATPNIINELSLTPEQRELLKEQRYQERYKMINTRNKIRLKELELRHELEKKEINREAVDKILAELKKLQSNILEQRVEAILKMKEILTPEQFEKLQSISEQRYKNRGRFGSKINRVKKQE